jgi:hypothetical protein
LVGIIQFAGISVGVGVKAGVEVGVRVGVREDVGLSSPFLFPGRNVFLPKICGDMFSLKEKGEKSKVGNIIIKIPVNNNIRKKLF